METTTQNRYLTAQYHSAFPHNDRYLSLYLSLREGGDSHSVAVETIRGEIFMDALLRKANS